MSLKQSHYAHSASRLAACHPPARITPSAAAAALSFVPLLSNARLLRRFFPYVPEQGRVEDALGDPMEARRLMSFKHDAFTSGGGWATGEMPEHGGVAPQYTKRPGPGSAFSKRRPGTSCRRPATQADGVATRPCRRRCPDAAVAPGRRP